MGSTRFPGKVVQEVAGAPILQMQVERIRSRGGHDVVIATSDLAPDDRVAAMADEIGVPVVRGSEQDVLGRFHETLREHPAEFFVRLTADCPLTDPDIITAVVKLFLDRGSDYSSNVHPRTFPKGLDVEVVRTKALEVASEEAVDPAEREHVTPFLYRHPERFRLSNLRSGVNAGHVNWAIDEPQDLERIRGLVGSATDRRARWHDLYMRSGNDEMQANTMRFRPAEMDDSEILLSWRNDPMSVMQSRSRGEIPRSEHDEWLGSVLNNPAYRLSIALDGETPVGMVRVDIEAAEGEVSIVVAPNARGRGYSTSILKTLQSELQDDYQIKVLHAHVRSGNLPSLRAFQGSGFKASDNGAEWIHLTWENQNTAGSSAREGSE